MDKLEKIERLRERADVTYEEALNALDASGEDLLDAIVYLERQGKVKKPEQAVYSTEYEEQKEYIDVSDKVEQQKQSAPSLGKSLGKLIRALVRFVKHTSFLVTRHGTELFRMPSWIMVILLLFFWKAAVPVCLAALLFGVRYSFEGSADTSAANSILEKAGHFADGVESGLRREKGENQERETK